MQQQLNSVTGKLDYLEGQSRRKKLRFNGIHGCYDENVAESQVIY